jgi:hypothetical protein
MACLSTPFSAQARGVAIFITRILKRWSAEGSREQIMFCIVTELSL